jgi:O-antigen/teichoic acid export membrane protein
VHVELDVFLAILIACLVMSCDAVSLVWYGVIRGKRDLRFEAIGMLIGQVCTAILAITAVELSWGAAGLVFALLCGSAWNVGWSMWRAWKLGLWPNGRDSWSLRRLIPAALPFALAGLFVKVYSFIDSLLLRHYDGFATVGQYAVANKLTYAFQFLPLTFAAALYPAMSSAHAEKDRASLERTLYGSLRLMMLVSIPLAAVISALSSTIILTFYKTTYSEAIIPLSILVWVLPALFLDFPVGSLLNATRRSFKKTIAMGITMVVNVGLNVWLIPRFGMLGASFTALISFWLLLAVGLWFVRHDLASQAWKTILLFVRGAGAALVIWYIVQAVTGDMPFVMALLFSGAVSVLALFLFRLLLVKDVMFCIRWLLRRPVEPPSEAEEEAGTHV